ncbi:MAG TPA: helix-turn-helix domain-containing protein [Halothiobacillus sp.]|nr:helix-turn-helix domain-containing protein [Halothiobacillus sp.]
MNDQAIHDITQRICAQLGYERPPVNITPAETSQILGATVGTLEVWRCTGRYNLPYVKVGRLVRYPLKGIAEFLAGASK